MKASSLLKLASTVAVATLLAACSPNRLMGTQLNNFSMEHVVPKAMTLDDPVLICHGNESFIPLLLGFTEFDVDTDIMLSISYTGAAMCTESEAAEKELWYMLASKQGWYNVAMDARIAQQLLNRDAGNRQVKAYNYMAHYFKKHYNYDIGEGKCPTIYKDLEQQVLLTGATSALQALQNDIASGRLVDVDMSLPSKVTHAMSCLDNEKWWGEPKAMQAAMRTILPKDSDDEVAAWKELQEATDIGLQGGVRLSHAIYASMAATKGRDDLLRDALKRFEAIPPASLNPKYKLLNQMAEVQVRKIADRYWMQNQGHRAPTTNFSQFWDENKPANVDTSLLDGLK